ncbi:MAG: aldo/keto reductase [Limnoraphis robusta]|uniref:aldo/keto reductase n=1 Tax=Limnoraphis robusta TaxID=1118279 RepID=UPI0009E6247D|nr:aldo/keto reductase [Limnoraphis robusta]
MSNQRPGADANRFLGDFNRRQFLKGVGFIGVGASTGLADHILHSNTSVEAAEFNTSSAELILAQTSESSGEIPRRPLGKTGVEVSAIGLGGATLGQAKSKEEAIRIIHEATDNGITFMDNAWEYNNHRSEEWMGEALQGRRDQVFLMTKVCTHGRDASVAMQQLEESLRRLKTDYIDLWQIHEVIYYNDPELIFRPDGAIEALERAKQEGKVKFVGFTGHKDPAIHLEMLSHNYPFDTVQLPINCFDASFMSFQNQVLPELDRQGIAAIGMKSLSGNGEAVKKGLVTPQEAIRYAMSMPIATLVSGIDSVEVLRQNIAIARDFQPMTAQEMQALRERVVPYATDGRFELFKSSKKFDADVGRKQHGFPTQDQLPT